MECETVRRHLPGLIQGTLPGAVRREVFDHVAACSACRMAFTEADPLASLPVLAPAPPVPHGFLPRVVAAAKSGAGRQVVHPWDLVAWWCLASPAMRLAGVASMALGLALGLVMGVGIAPPSTLPSSPEVRRAALENDGINVFAAAPRGSLADSYVTLVLPSEEDAP